MCATAKRRRSAKEDKVVRAEQPPTDVENPLLAPVIRVGEVLMSGFQAPAADLFAEGFVFHYFNPRLADLSGDYEGLEGMKSFFGRLMAASEGTFRLDPISLTPFGDELVAAFATHTLTVGGADLEVDAVVLWRVVEGRLAEAWDIPAVNTARPASAAADS